MPDGGSSTGAGASAAASLVLAARALGAVARADRDSAGVAAQADALARRAGRLAAENEAAYERVSDLLGHRGQVHPVVLAAALADSGDVPLRVAAAGCDVAELAAEFAHAGPGDHRADAVVCAILAAAAAAAGATLVAINLSVTSGDPRREAADRSAKQAGEARDAALLTLGSELA